MFSTSSQPHLPPSPLCYTPHRNRSLVSVEGDAKVVEPEATVLTAIDRFSWFNHPDFRRDRVEFQVNEGVAVVAATTYLAKNDRAPFLRPPPVPGLRPAEMIPRVLVPPEPSRVQFIQESANIHVGPSTLSSIPPLSAASCNRTSGNRVCIVSG